MTGMSNRQDLTNMSLVTEENFLGTSERLQVKNQMEREDLFGASGSTLLRKNLRGAHDLTNDLAFRSKEDEDGDEANIDGTLESPNLRRRKGGPYEVGKSKYIESEDQDLGGNIDSEDKNDETDSSNRQNIHGATDSVIYKNLGIQPEDLRESQVQRMAERAQMSKKKSLIQGRLLEDRLLDERLQGEDVIRHGHGQSNVEVSNTDISALNDMNDYRQDED